MQTTASGVLVTGATGFIGQHIVSKLIANGHKVSALIRPEKTFDPRLPATCSQIPASITDVEQLEKIVSTCSAVVYCAGSVRGGRLEDFQAANVAGLQAMLMALAQSEKTLPLLLISSLAASRPDLSDYASSKFNGEQCLAAAPGLPWTILRPPAIYGPGDREMIPILKLAAKGWVLNAGPRDQRVSLLHVQDLAAAVLAWLNQPEACRQQTYSIDDGTANGYDWQAITKAAGATGFHRLSLPRSLLATVAQLNVWLAKGLGYAPMFTPGKVRELTQPEWLSQDNARFEAATGWHPTMNLKTGLQELLAAKGD